MSFVMASLRPGYDQGRDARKASAMTDGIFGNKKVDGEGKQGLGEDLEDHQSSKIVVVEKVLVSSKFHIQPNTSALRPQWGNPRGFTVQAIGDTLFVANLEKERNQGKNLGRGAMDVISNRAVALDDF
jgi:hypothetical protein